MSTKYDKVGCLLQNEEHTTFASLAVLLSIPVVSGWH